jgi:hypothetical protein
VNNNQFILTYQANANPYHYAHQWAWDLGSSSANPLQLSYTGTGTKEVRLILTTQYFCRDTVLKPLFVKSLPAPPSAIQGPVTAVNVSNEFNYSVVSQAGQTYKWQVSNGTFVNGDTTATVKVKWITAGTGKLIVQNTFSGCSNKDSLSLTIGSVGLTEEAGIRQFSIQPNPNSGIFRLQLTSGYKQKLVIRLYNTLGEEVHMQQAETQAGENTVEVKSDLAAGVYLLSVSGKDVLISQKLVIHH